MRATARSSPATAFRGKRCHRQAPTWTEEGKTKIHGMEGSSQEKMEVSLTRSQGMLGITRDYTASASAGRGQGHLKQVSSHPTKCKHTESASVQASPATPQRLRVNSGQLLPKIFVVVRSQIAKNDHMYTHCSADSMSADWHWLGLVSRPQGDNCARENTLRR